MLLKMNNQQQSWGGEEGLPQEVRGAAEDGCKEMKSGCPKVGGTGNGKGVHSLSHKPTKALTSNHPETSN